LFKGIGFLIETCRAEVEVISSSSWRIPW